MNANEIQVELASNNLFFVGKGDIIDIFLDEKNNILLYFQNIFLGKCSNINIQSSCVAVVMKKNFNRLNLELLTKKCG